ncbi:UDP-glycosyltransferase 74B1-like [Hibiscus syriacus]|uniref:UDP-glycosyltransferase 74B1-like n=1 Tax=Hibiscus syriacus TaxID=106335 RepID=A0A6A2ZKZ0_HIBSY|nr:UDP-glycosyltransferase 74B1-like [Hibiscus syriacus]
MAFSSTLSLYSHPKVIPKKQRLGFDALASDHGTWPGPDTAWFITTGHGSRSKRLVITAAYGAEGGARRRVYRQSQSQQPLGSSPVNQIATSSSVEAKSPSQGVKWSFAPGTNLLSGIAAKIERQSTQMLNEFAKELRTFDSVDMSGRNFGDDGLFFLAESLGYNQIVEEVSFAANGITATGIKAFDGVLQANTVLKTLNFSGNPIGDEGVKCLCDILVNNGSIQKLQLNSVDLGDEGAKAIAELLKKNSTLRVLELNNNMIDYSGFTSLAGALVENNSIRHLHLNGNYGGALGANALAKGLDGNKSLRVNGKVDGGVRSLISGLSSHKGKITLLDFGNNSITAKGAFHVAEYIKRSKNLLWVNLYMNDIGDEGAEKIAEALKENRTITTIDLGGNNIRAKGVGAISEALKDNAVITNLELGYNPIGADGAKALSEVLKFHGNVKTLKLGWCQIGPKGAEFIADMLRYNNTISILDLRANGLRDEGAGCLARSLKVVNEALTSLDLGFNEIRDDGAFAIAQALKANEDVTVTSLNLASNFLTKFGQSALSDARDHVFEMSEKEVDIFF